MSYLFFLTFSASSHVCKYLINCSYSNSHVKHWGELKKIHTKVPSGHKTSKQIVEATDDKKNKSYFV